MSDGSERWFLKALVQGMVFALVVAAASAAFGPWLGERVAKATKPATCSDTRDLRRNVPVSVEASSHLTAEGKLRYDESKLIDGDSGTAWVEGKKGLGIGEQVTFNFSDSIDIRLLCVINGYANTWDLYQRNARVRGLDVVADDSSKNIILSDAGSPDHPAAFQDVSLDMESEQLQLTITSAYAGSGRDRYTDTSISEVEVWST
jgi:hypothetical protein